MVENLPFKPSVLLHTVVNSVFGLLALIVVTLRLIARMVKRYPLGKDDFLVISAVVTIVLEYCYRTRDIDVYFSRLRLLCISLMSSVLSSPPVSYRCFYVNDKCRRAIRLGLSYEYSPPGQPYQDLSGISIANEAT
jgi:hypothetical protein